MIARTLLQVGALMFLILGTIHLLYTFFTNKFSSKNESVIREMKASFPILTRKTTLWKAWVGFNASHSLGAIFIGVVNIYMADQCYFIIQNGAFFSMLNIMMAGAYLLLAKKYWFDIPFLGILIAFFCFLASGLLLFFA